MHLWFQALSRLRIPQFSSLDGVFPSRLIIWRTENFSAARIVPAPKMILLIRKYDTQTTQKNPLEEYMSFIVHCFAVCNLVDAGKILDLDTFYQVLHFLSELSTKYNLIKGRRNQQRSFFSAP